MAGIRFFASVLLICCYLPLSAQCGLWETWFNQGGPPWHQWITLAPGLMGPNALPVPEIGKGEMPTDLVFENRMDAHFMPGDKTRNLFTSLSVPFSKRIAAQLYFVPLEHYDLSCELRLKRHTQWGREGTGFAIGDVYFGTVMQLVKDKPKWPDILLRMYARTASGNKLYNLRFTDTPGYFFDLSFGKNLSAPIGESIRIYGMSGFYVWHTFAERNHQNDAFLFGTGLDWQFGDWKVANQVGGYLGYIGVMDKPVVYRGEVQYKKRQWEYFFRYQKGLHHFEYHTFSAGVKFHYGLLEKLGWE